MTDKPTDAEMIEWYDKNVSIKSSQHNDMMYAAIRHLLASLTPTKDAIRSAEDWAKQIGFSDGKPLLELEVIRAIQRDVLNVAEQRGYERGMANAVPDGWQVVPKDCTTKMMESFWSVRGAAATFDTGYAAMLAAAPSPAKPEGK